VVIGPGLFEAVGEFLHGLGALRAPEDDSDCGSTYTGKHPKKISHLRHLLVRIPDRFPDFNSLCCWLDARNRLLDGRRRRATLASMDSERFGRVLGVGARLAAKTVAEAVDAATAPNPSAKNDGAGTDSRAASGAVPATPKAVPIRPQVRETGRGLKREGKRFGEALWGPFARLSGVLWLEFTGVFFGLFALTMGVGLWRQRGTVLGAGAGHEALVRFLLLAGVALLFGYFCVSSFLRAGRKSRQR
jgi:hypothetical protein